MGPEYYEEAKRADVLSKNLISSLLENMEYVNNISFINYAIEILGIIKTRIDRGDKITDEVSKTIYDKKNFKEFVKKNFSQYIYDETFPSGMKTQKVYFSLEACEDGYNLVMAPSSTEKTYRWISSLSERFSLVEMIATGVVYIKDTKTNVYTPFISKHGNYCRYQKDLGRIVELD